MATDAIVETTLFNAFATFPLIKSKTVSGKTVKNVYWPNEPFDRSLWADDGWYEVDLLPGVPEQIEFGTEGRNRWVGLLQITICTPLGRGKAMANARYEALASIFKRGAFFSGVEIDGIYRADRDGNDEDHYRLPVRIEYRADIEN